LITWSWSGAKAGESRLKLMSTTGEHRVPAVVPPTATS
jgi:hypothetical protein